MSFVLVEARSDCSDAQSGSNREDGTCRRYPTRFKTADRTTAQQQSAGRSGVPDSQIETPAILVEKCDKSDSGSDSVGDDDCADFDTQKEEQAHMYAYGDVSGLDANDDGIACDRLP